MLGKDCSGSCELNYWGIFWGERSELTRLRALLQIDAVNNYQNDQNIKKIYQIQVMLRCLVGIAVVTVN